MINALIAAQVAARLPQELKKYLRPRLLVLDKLGYLPIDKQGADLLFQVISGRYEHGSILLTTNKPFNQWASIFNNDNTLASAVLDRLLHHARIVIIEGASYRMKEKHTPHEHPQKQTPKPFRFQTARFMPFSHRRPHADQTIPVKS